MKSKPAKKQIGKPSGTVLTCAAAEINAWAPLPRGVREKRAQQNWLPGSVRRRGNKSGGDAAARRKTSIGRAGRRIVSWANRAGTKTESLPGWWKIRRRNQIRHRRSGHCARASHGTWARNGAEPKRHRTRSRWRADRARDELKIGRRRELLERGTKPKPKPQRPSAARHRTENKIKNCSDLERTQRGKQGTTKMYNSIFHWIK
jgi:hypothetical protein